MNHTLTQIWVHAIWCTRDRKSLIKTVFQAPLNRYLRYKLQEMDCPVRVINGTSDHVHLLFQLGHEVPLTRLIEHTQRESARWVHEQHFLQIPFSWQPGYCALSVSGSMVQRVEAFIREQRLFHQKTTFIQEYRQFLTKCGFVENEWMRRNVRRARMPFSAAGKEAEWDSLTRFGKGTG